MAQVVEHLPRKHKALNSDVSATKRKKSRNWKTMLATDMDRIQPI
jgi:hypothetical protein